MKWHFSIRKNVLKNMFLVITKVNFCYILQYYNYTPMCEKYIYVYI